MTVTQIIIQNIVYKNYNNYIPNDSVKFSRTNLTRMHVIRVKKK